MGGMKIPDHLRRSHPFPSTHPNSEEPSGTSEEPSCSLASANTTHMKLNRGSRRGEEKGEKGALLP